MVPGVGDRGDVAKEARDNFEGDRSILDLDCDGSYMIVCMNLSKFIKLYKLKFFFQFYFMQILPQ